MKKGSWVVLVILLIIVAVGIWWWQSSSPAQTIAENVAPDMEVISVNVSNIGGERIKATSEIELSNPFPVDLRTNNIEYEIFVDSIKVIEDAYNEPIDIAESDSEVIEVPMEILADPMGRVFDYFKEQNIDSAEYVIKMSILSDVPVNGEEEFNFEISKTLPSFQMLDFELQNLDLNILSSDKGIDVVLSVTNPNHYPLKLENGKFYLTVEDKLELSGEMEDFVNIPANGTEEVAVHARKESGSLTQSALRVLFDQEGTNFQYVFSYTINSENEMFNNTEMETNITGTLDEITGAL